MLMKLRWFSRAEDRLDAWVTRQHQERVLDGRTAPVGACPDEAFLESVAQQSKQIALSDPRVDHAANCPVCMRRLLELRSQHQSRRRRLVFTSAVGCCLLIVAAFAVVSWQGTNKPHPVDNMAAIPETIDLSNAGTLRSLQSDPTQPSPLQSVSLPRALVKVNIILPRYSRPGRYSVAVTRDQTVNDPLARGSATAIGNGDQEEVAIDLDLRKSKPGSYFLSTTHEQDQASYYYPLQIK
jgi:hypothetical protein